MKNLFTDCKAIVFEEHQCKNRQLQFEVQNALFNDGYVWYSDLAKREKKHNYYVIVAYVLDNRLCKTITFSSCIGGESYEEALERLRRDIGKENMILVKDYLNSSKFYNASCMDTE